MAKYGVEFTREFDKLLNNLATTEAVPAKNKADTITRAVALYSFLHSKTMENLNARVAIVDITNNEILLVIYPLP